MTLRAVLLGATAFVTMSVFTSALAESPMSGPLKVTSAEFTPTPAPANDLEMALPYTRSEAVVTPSSVMKSRRCICSPQSGDHTLPHRFRTAALCQTRSFR